MPCKSVSWRSLITIIACKLSAEDTKSLRLYEVNCIATVRNWLMCTLCGSK